MLYPLSYGGSATERVPGRCGLPGAAGRGRYGGAVPERPPRVLVVDDEAVIRQLIAINLELEGFDAVGQARRGEGARGQ